MSGDVEVIQAADKFWAKVDRRGPDECWPWLGRLNHRGYGQLWADDAERRATHVALEAAGRHRPSPSHCACHTCDNPPCVNPAHLWWGTRTENMSDCVRKGRNGMLRKTHCPQGHPYSGKNLYTEPAGYRRCKTCLNATKRRRWARKKAAAGHAVEQEGR